MTPPLLVLGIGNPWASDDGVGPEVVRRAQARWQNQERDATREVGFEVFARPDLSLLERLATSQQVIIVDAVQSGARPGTLHRLVWDEAAWDSRGVERASSHGFGVGELLQMAEALGKLPPRVELWGIEIASTEPGRGLSAPVARPVNAIAQELARALITLFNKSAEADRR